VDVSVTLVGAVYKHHNVQGGSTHILEMRGKGR
jgi:hypothetical protein